jgi:hypothetical protein
MLEDNKTLMHRYFFYNFLISAGFQDLLILAGTMSHLNPIFTLSDFRCQLFLTLNTVVCQIARSKQLNDQVDAAIIGDFIMEQSSLVSSKTLKVRDFQESGETATVALIRMITSNMQIILQDCFRAQ